MGKIGQLAGGLMLGGYGLYHYGATVSGISTAANLAIAGKEIAKLLLPKEATNFEKIKKKLNAEKLNEHLKEVVESGLAWVVAAIVTNYLVEKISPQLGIHPALHVTALGAILNCKNLLPKRVYKEIEKGYEGAVEGLCAFFKIRRSDYFLERISKTLTYREEKFIQNISDAILLAGVLLTATTGLKILGYRK